MYNLIILMTGVFILLLLSYVLNGHDFFSPSFIICILFLVSSAFALYSVNAWNVSEDSISIEGTLIILSGIAVFFLTEKTVRTLIVSRNSNKEIPSEITPIHPSNIRYCIVIGICFVSTVLYSYFLYKYMQLNGYTGGFNIASIALAHHQLTFQSEREGSIPRIVRILGWTEIAIMFVSIYLFMHNTVLCKEKIKKNLRYFLPALIYLPVSLLASSRSVYLQYAGSAVFLLYIMICRKNKWRKQKRNNNKIIRIASMIFVSVLSLFYIASISGLIGRQTERTFFDYISVYIGAPIINFNLFLENPPTYLNDYFGQETFSGLNSLFVSLGIHSSEYSSQLERRWINGINAGNVYTFFRRPYHDFGLFGMYIVVIATAFVFSYVYYKKIYRKPQSYKTDKTLILYSYFFYIIYLFSILNNMCNLISLSQFYFLVSFTIIYAFMMGKIRISFKRVKSKRIV